MTSTPEMHQTQKRKRTPESDEALPPTSDEHQTKRLKPTPETDEGPEPPSPPTPDEHKTGEEKSTPESDEDSESLPSPLFDSLSPLSTAASSPMSEPSLPTPDEDQTKERKPTPESGEGSELSPPTSGKYRTKEEKPTPEPKLLIKKHSKDARTPTRGSTMAAGYDLYSAEAKVIPARGQGLIDTQISVMVPPGTYGRVAPRSGLAAKFGIDTGAGVIDADYRGILFILLFNLGEKEFKVNVGDRVAQLVLERIYTPEVCLVDELDETIRGSGGFGSTGVAASPIKAWC